MFFFPFPVEYNLTIVSLAQEEGQELKIGYLNGNRLYYAFLAGGNAVIEDQKYLNKINVFPVPDADTGTNLASTMRSIAESAIASRSIKTTLQSIEDAALSGARGNSGIIFAQFLHGISKEIKIDMKVSTKAFGESVRKAVHYAYKSIISPVEGTMLTVMRDWAEAVYRQRTKTNDYAELLAHSLSAARKSLRETPKKLSVLAKAGVVDAGAKGFVDFLEGITNFIKKGKLKFISKPESLLEPFETKVHSRKKSIDYRYCSEALIIGKDINIEKLKEEIGPFGASAIVAGSDKKARIHIHTDSPADLFSRVKNFGSVTQIKIDDMNKQYEVSHERKSRIALVTDSSCDLPQEMIDDYQIHVIPFNLSFGDSLYLDKLTITPEQFYNMLKTSKDLPKSSQPSLPTIQNTLSFLASHYESIIVVNISDKLSGMHQFSQQAIERIDNKRINIINSKNLSASLGLIVFRIAEAISMGKVHNEIIKQTEEWISKTRLLVDICTMKYLVRSGRVSPMKGLLAKVLNLKPILCLDSEGKASSSGKSFSRKKNMKKILRIIKEMSKEGEIWKYAIVHAQNLMRAQIYAEKIREETGLKPAYIMDVSPVIGVHSGIGVVAVALMLK